MLHTELSSYGLPYKTCIQTCLPGAVWRLCILPLGLGWQTGPVQGTSGEKQIRRVSEFASSSFSVNVCNILEY